MSSQPQMASVRSRPSQILVVAAARIPSVELAAILPLRELARRGVCQFVYADELRVKASHITWADGLFCVRACSTRSRAIAETARAAGRRVISYYDDDFMNLPPGSASQTYFASTGIYQRLQWFLQESDTLCFSSPLLAEDYGRLSSRPAVLLKAGIECPPVSQASRQRVRILFAGSIDHGSFLNTTCKEALEAAIASYGERVELYCLGARPQLVSQLPVQYVPYIENYADYREFVACLSPDICLAPLPEGDFFARKFHNKLLDYGSLGGAIIFSNVPPYREAVQDGETGLLVSNDPAAWREALLYLIENREVCERLGASALSHVQTHYTVEQAADSYEQELAAFFAHRAPVVPESACIIPDRGQFREYLADHGLGRTLRRGMKKFLGI